MGLDPIKCTICQGDNPARTHVDVATHVAAQSSDNGRTVTWVLLCVGHAEDWNDCEPKPGAWVSPIFELGARIE